MKTKLLLTLFFAALASFAFAQETTSEIQGLVTAGNNGIGNATVQALHVPTGTKYYTTTRKDGVITFQTSASVVLMKLR